MLVQHSVMSVKFEEEVLPDFTIVADIFLQESAGLWRWAIAVELRDAVFLERSF